MNRIVSTVLGLALALLVAAQTTNSTPVLTDGKGFRIEYREARIEQTSPERLDVLLTGVPLRGESREQGFTFTARKFQGQLRYTENESILLQTGTLSGDVVATLIPRENAALRQTFRGQSVTITDKGNTTALNLTGNVSFTGFTDGGQPVTLTGSRGDATLSPLSERRPALRSATISGNSRLSLKSETGTSSINSDRLTVTQRGSVLDFSADQDVQFGDNRTTNGRNQVLTLSTNRVLGTLDPQRNGRDQVRSLRAPGAVTLTLRYVQNGNALSVTAKGEDLRYSGDTRVITLRNASYNGIQRRDGDAPLFGTLTGDLMTITLDPEGSVTKIELTAEKGQGTLRQGEAPTQP